MESKNIQSSRELNCEHYTNHTLTGDPVINNHNHVSGWLSCYITDQKKKTSFSCRLPWSYTKRKLTTTIKKKQVLQQFISNLCRVLVLRQFCKDTILPPGFHDCHNLETRLLIVCFLYTKLVTTTSHACATSHFRMGCALFLQLFLQHP